ncbi:MAG: hypothetical protein O8C67_11545 [Candidatus Methanoperedens sp.]|nr:hypothetical protein [Candidatus Methanoperedens sp.]
MLFPVIHILTVSFGLIIGEDNATSIYNVAIWMPTIISVILALFVFLMINKISGKSKPALLGTIILVSLPFISRWLMQFTRTTMAIAFLTVLGYLLIKTDQDKITPSLNILIITLIFTIILAHPVVSFFGVLSLIFIFIYEIVRTSLGSKLDKIVEGTPTAKKFDMLVWLSIIILVTYWMYNAYMLNPFIKTAQSFYSSFQTFFKDSIISEILYNRAEGSYSVASTEYKIFGLLRVVLFITASLIGLLLLSFDKKFKSIVIPLSVFAFIFWAVNYGMSLSSTTFYRTAVYSSLWLIIPAGYFIHKINEKQLNKFRKTLIFALLITFIIIPAPFFTGEVVLPSDWLYSPHPIKQIDYEHGEAQRFLEHYHTDVPLWINKYTDKTSLIWSDGTYSYAAILGYGERKATYSNVVLTKDGISVNRLKTLNVNYVEINDLMRRALIIPYGIPPFYPYYTYNELEINSHSYKIYDSGDANVYKIS